MNSLAGKVAVVTGGSRGIGRAIVERLAADGADVLFSYVDDGAAADQVVAGAAASPGEVHATRADLANIADVRALFERAAAQLGGVDADYATAGGSSASRRSTPYGRLRTSRCTARARPRSSSSQPSPPRNSAGAGSRSTRCRPASPTPTYCAPSTHRKRSHSSRRCRRSGGSGSPTTSPIRSRSSPVMPAAGSPAKTCGRAAASLSSGGRR